MTAYAELVSEVLEVAQGCPEPVIERNIRNSVIELCETALLLRTDLDAITLQADVASYALTPPANRTIIEVFSATVCDSPPLAQYSSDFLDLMWRENTTGSFRWNNDSTETTSLGADWRTYTQSRPQVFHVLREDTQYRIRMVGIPCETIADALQCKLVLKPTRESTEVDSWLVEDHYQLLIAGAKARTLLTPKTKWYEPQLGAMFAGMFETGKMEAKRKALRDFVRDDETSGHVKAWP